MKLTGTNNSIGLIVRIAHAHLFSLTLRIAFQRNAATARARRNSAGLQSKARASPEDGFGTDTASRKFEHALCRPGGYGGAAAPDPIPNSAVKRSSADGTSSQDAGE